MTDKTNTHALPAWTEVEYTALCKNPYLLTPFFIPKEAKCFTCREDGTREEERMVFLVFKSTAAPADAEWEDDPIPCEVWLRALGDDDEEIEPAKVIYLGQDIEDFIRVAAEDDQTITFDFWWRHGEVKVEKAEKTDDGFVCRKDDFGDDGLAVTLIPEDGGNPVVLRLQIPYIGFSLYDAEGNKVHGELSIPQDKVDDYTYEFVGDDNNDRFTLQLDSNRLVYMCVLRHEDHQLVVRNQRDRLSVVDQIPTEGKLSELLMNTNSALIKNRNHRWRIQIEGTTLSHEVELNVDAASLVAFAEEQMQKGMEIDELGQHLMALEQKYHFQWFWLSEDDWSHDNPVFDMFMKQLCAFSYVSQNPVQADALMARNYKRKIRRYSSMLKAHKRGELNLFEESDEVRAEYLRIFQGFHQPFVEAFEKEEEE